jgi:hypothetical protein
MCLNETCSEVHISKHHSNTFSIHKGLKIGDNLLPLVFNFALEQVIRKVTEIRVELKLNGTLLLFV